MSPSTSPQATPPTMSELIALPTRRNQGASRNRRGRATGGVPSAGASASLTADSTWAGSTSKPTLVMIPFPT